MKLQNFLPQNIINPDKARKAVSALTKDGELLPVILLESTVVGGRTLQAYKRNGYTEARERFTEEIVGSVFWLFGVKMFNKLGDAFGKHVLKLPFTEFDVGKDALRTPFENVADAMAKMGAQNGGKVRQISKNALAGFKFGKIITSVIAATTLIGVVMPKINQALTKKIVEKSKNKNEPNVHPKHLIAPHLVNGSFGSIEDFKRKVTTQGQTSFKGAGVGDAIATVAHNMENHAVYKLLSTDVGILTGRTVNARNNDERVEIAFRDGASIYFYLACTKHVIKLLEKLNPMNAIAKLEPSSAKIAHDMLSKELQEAGGKLSIEDFRSRMIGSITEENKSLLNGLEFSNDVISLDKLKHLPEEVFEKAKLMSGLQPEQAKVGAVLTKQQVMDVLSDGKITSPKFLMDMYENSFGKADLHNPYKFISMKQIQSFRENIDTYVNTIVDFAKKNNQEIDLSLLKKMSNKNLIKAGGFFGAGFLVSAAFLSTIIPKTQYLITKLRTGKNEFPGLEGHSNEHKKQVV